MSLFLFAKLILPYLFTPEESGWCQLMLLYLEAAERDDFEGLPHSPSDLP